MRVKTKPNVDVGVTFTNNDGLDFIVDEIVEIKKYEKMCKITFLESGYSAIVGSSSITKGSVKDYYQITILGVACFGDAKTNPRHTKQTYRIYKNMLHRCYDEKNKDYNSYGGIGVSVCSNWLNYNNFLNDLYDIEGFDFEKFENGEISMDKDKKQKYIPKNERIYSKETCCFISTSENSTIRNFENSLNPEKRKILITYPDGNTETIDRTELKIYCEKKGFTNPNHIRRVLRKERNSYKNIKFELVD